jgi:hypothetical protein
LIICFILGLFPFEAIKNAALSQFFIPQIKSKEIIDDAEQNNIFKNIVKCSFSVLKSSP